MRGRVCASGCECGRDEEKHSLSTRLDVHAAIALKLPLWVFVVRGGKKKCEVDNWSGNVAFATSPPMELKRCSG